MSRWAYWLRVLACWACIVIYGTTNNPDVIWLFCATWLILAIEVDRIMAEIKKGKK